jgi:hypothetical protein
MDLAIPCGGKMQYPHMTLIHIIRGSPKCNTCMTIKDAHCMWAQMQYPHYDLNPRYMWEP